MFIDHVSLRQIRPLIAWLVPLTLTQLYSFPAEFLLFFDREFPGYNFPLRKVFYGWKCPPNSLRAFGSEVVAFES